MRAVRAVQLRRMAARPCLQSPFKYPRDMDSLQSALAGLPTAGVYVAGAALALGLGGGGYAAAQALAPGEPRRW